MSTEDTGDEIFSSDNAYNRFQDTGTQQVSLEIRILVDTERKAVYSRTTGEIAAKNLKLSLQVEYMAKSAPLYYRWQD